MELGSKPQLLEAGTKEPQNMSFYLSFHDNWRSMNRVTVRAVTQPGIYMPSQSRGQEVAGGRGDSLCFYFYFLFLLHVSAAADSSCTEETRLSIGGHDHSCHTAESTVCVCVCVCVWVCVYVCVCVCVCVCGV